MRLTTKLLSVTVLVCLASVPAWAQCVPYTQEIKGPFFFGWQAQSVVTTLDGQQITLYPVEGSSEPPVDRGWSTHGYETFVAATEPEEANTFELVTPFVSTVEKTDPRFIGDRRDIPPYVVVRYWFKYLGEGKMTSGAGAFDGAKGHVVTRGPFWLDLVNIPEWGGIVPAQVVAAVQDPQHPLITPGTYGGYYEFTTKGQFCGVDLKALGLQ